MIKAKLKYSNNFAMNSMGRKGRLALIYNEDCEVKVINHLQYHIHVYVTDKDSMASWNLTSFYGHPECSKRDQTLNLLPTINSNQNRLWCVIRYFNKILKQDEKKGGNARATSQMEKFKSAP